MWENERSVSLVLVSLVPLFRRLCVCVADEMYEQEESRATWRHSCHSRMCDVNDRWRQKNLPKTKKSVVFVYVRPLFPSLCFRLRLGLRQPVIIEKELYQIIPDYSFHLPSHFLYIVCDVGLCFWIKVKCVVALLIHKISPMDSTHEIPKQKRNQSENYYLFFPKLKEKKMSNNKQSSTDLVGFLQTWTGSERFTI